LIQGAELISFLECPPCRVASSRTLGHVVVQRTGPNAYGRLQYCLLQSVMHSILNTQYDPVLKKFNIEEKCIEY
jgi:hypothetical protein